MWNLIPQLFYDFIARLIPGATLLMTSSLVILGPNNALTYLVNSQKNRLFDFVPLLLWVLIAYLIGMIVGELWEISIGYFTKPLLKKNEENCKKQCLIEHNKFQKMCGCSELNIEARNFPAAYVMRDHLRSVAPSEAARLLKVRAEERLCHVLILGFFVLSIINIKYILDSLDMERIILEIILVVTIISCWSRAFRMRRHLITGTTVSWLFYSSSGQIPVSKLGLEGLKNDEK